MKSRNPSPPRWADTLLMWFCRNEVLENIQGDLHEIYQQRLATQGQRKADLLFVRDVFSVLRPRLIRQYKRTNKRNPLEVVFSNYKTSVRNLKHNALFSVINIVGLAISMSVGVLMIVLLTELRSFDDIHSKKDRIFRVTTHKQALLSGEPEHYATTSHYIADQIEAHAPGVEQVAVLDRKLAVELSTDSKTIPVKGYYATPNFFDVFSFRLLKGNPRTALTQPGAIILTASVAERLFGAADPLDKTVAVGNSPDFTTGIVSGIVQDPPLHSHLNFEALVSLKTMENSLVERHRKFSDNPGGYAQSYVYVVLKEKAKPGDVEEVMTSVLADYNSKKAPFQLSLQPMKEFVTREVGFQSGPIFSAQNVYVLSAFTFVVLLSACFNYANLSLARALRRSKEISVRKINGASRFQIFSQLMTEAVLLSVLAAVAGTGLYLLIKSEFLKLPELAPGGRAMFTLDMGLMHIVYIFVSAVGVGCIAGFLPACLLSKLSVGILFNSSGKTGIFSGFRGRQVLITAQIALSIGLITCAVIVHKQYRYVVNYDLGYQTGNIINIRTNGDYADALQLEYSAMAEVTGTSRSSLVLGTRNLLPADAMSEDRQDTIMFSCSFVDPNFLSLHGFQLIAGAPFHTRAEQSAARNKIIVNERFLKELDLGTADEAIGKNIWYFGEEKLQIQGVVKDFVSMSLDAEAPEAFGFLNGVSDEKPVMSVRILPTDLHTTMKRLETVYKKFDPVHPFEASLYADQIANTYAASKGMYTIISFVAFLSISISTLGLLGMAVFTIDTRMKEISIRKILGAKVGTLVLLLSRNFLVMIATAAVVAIPVAKYVVDDLVFTRFLYQTSVGPLEMLSGLLIVTTVVSLAVGWQVRTAALRNPTDLLRRE